MVGSYVQYLNEKILNIGKIAGKKHNSSKLTSKKNYYMSESNELKQK